MPRAWRRTRCARPRLVANHHILFGDKGGSFLVGRGEACPLADELLDYYTPEQLRAHFLALGLDQKSVGFKPKPFLATEEELADPRVADPVLKEGALLTNVFNRLARSCFDEAQKNFEGYLPLAAPRTPRSRARTRRLPPTTASC